MSKVMLVEDDNNLREIYEARLLAEGYEIVSARDGEEALALAVKERPDLIIADVMMPKISGFDMLDILRSTAETKNTKVIMMTALSQAEDKARAAQLGADRYLVKSQVTLEDVARVAKEVLDGTPAGPSSGGFTSTPIATPPPPEPVAPLPPAPATTTPPEPIAPIVTQPEPVAPIPVPAPTVNLTPPAMAAPLATEDEAVKMSEPIKQEESEIESQIAEFANAPAVDPPVVAIPSDATNTATSAIDAGQTSSTSTHSKVIQPLSDMSTTNGTANLEDLLAKEKIKDDMARAVAPILNRDMAQNPNPAPSTGNENIDPNAIAL
jgi:CheY-like chemotaxis protein